MTDHRKAEKPVVVSAGETAFVEFKLRGLGGVKGIVENQYTDALLKGVRIQLLDKSGSVLQEATSGDDGGYRFEHVRAGTYTVSLSLPKGYRSNDPTDQTVKVDTGVTARADFTIHRHGNVQGRVADDASGAPLEGIEVDLVDSAGTVVRTVVTDVDGNYEFGELEVDKYTLRLAVPDNYEPDSAED